MAALHAQIHAQMLIDLGPMIKAKVAARMEREREQLTNDAERSALVRIAAAMQQAGRTGRPVVIEVAGEPVCFAVPPPGTTPTHSRPN